MKIEIDCPNCGTHILIFDENEGFKIVDKGKVSTFDNKKQQ